jgi:hypothetical protein
VFKILIGVQHRKLDRNSAYDSLVYSGSHPRYLSPFGGPGYHELLNSLVGLSLHLVSGSVHGAHNCLRHGKHSTLDVVVSGSNRLCPRPPHQRILGPALVGWIVSEHQWLIGELEDSSDNTVSLNCDETRYIH